MKKSEINICMGSSCYVRGNEENLKLIEDYIEKNHLDAEIHLCGSNCARQCADGPNITIGGILYQKVNKADLPEILDKVFGGRAKDSMKEKWV